MEMMRPTGNMIRRDRDGKFYSGSRIKGPVKVDPDGEEYHDSVLTFTNLLLSAKKFCNTTIEGAFEFVTGASEDKFSIVSAEQFAREYEASAPRYVVRRIENGKNSGSDNQQHHRRHLRTR